MIISCRLTFSRTRKLLKWTQVWSTTSDPSGPAMHMVNFAKSYLCVLTCLTGTSFSRHQKLLLDEVAQSSVRTPDIQQNVTVQGKGGCTEATHRSAEKIVARKKECRQKFFFALSRKKRRRQRCRCICWGILHCLFQKVVLKVGSMGEVMTLRC